jgi:NDP-sugar pyrophosphorylase family protein
MIAVIPAAGRGARMGALTDQLPKPLLPIGGRPILRRVIDEIAPSVDRIVVVVGYRGDQIRHAIATWAIDVSIVCVVQTESRGTADALLTALATVGRAPFLYAWGDVLVPRGLARQVLGAAKDSVGAIAVNRVDDTAEGAKVTVVDGWARDIVEKPADGGAGWNASGMGALPQDAWRMLSEVEPSVRGEYELTDVLRRLASTDRLRAVPARGPVVDVGTPERLVEAEHHFGRE